MGREGRCRIPFWRLKALWWRCGLENGLQVLLRIPGAFIALPAIGAERDCPAGVSELAHVAWMIFKVRRSPLLRSFIMIPASVHSCHWYYLYCCYYQIIITPGHTTHTHRDVPATGRHPAGRVSPPQMAQLTLPRPAGRLPTFGPSLPPSISDTASRASSHNKSMYVLPPCQTQLTPAPASNTHSASQSQSAQTIS